MRAVGARDDDHGFPLYAVHVAKHLALERIHAALIALGTRPSKTLIFDNFFVCGGRRGSVVVLFSAPAAVEYI